MTTNIKTLIILFFSIGISFDDLSIKSDFGTIIDGDIIYEKPFLGGFNKPKIQWLDWNGDGIQDLFVLDEDGRIKYYSANQGCNEGICYSLETTSFYNFENILWFFINDLNNDGIFDIITSNNQNSSLVSFYSININELTFNGLVKNDSGENISIDPTMIPCFADIDNDNDLDLFSGNTIGTVNYFNNIGLTDSNIPIFNLETNFWQEIYIVGSSLQQRHGASALNFSDFDNDNDLDLFWGDFFQQSLYVIYNNGDSSNPIMDNENFLTQFPLSNPALTAGLNMPSFGDIDSDGDDDLFVTVLSGAYGYQLKDNFIFYENQNNDYIKQTSNFINTLDLLSDVNPTFVDIDNDNDLDLFIGTDFDPSEFPWVGKVNFYENIGIDSNGDITWQKTSDNFLPNSEFSANNLYPEFVDIDFDGDYDLFIGDFNGLIHYFNNVGNTNIPEYKYNGTIDGIDLSGYSTPEFVDIDNDNDYDLLIGNMSGTIVYYENIGSIYEHDFILIDENFEDINMSFRSTIFTFNFGCENGFILTNGYGDIKYYKGDYSNGYIIQNNLSIPFLGLNVSLDFLEEDTIEGFIAGNSTGGLYFLPNSTFEGDLNNDFIVNVIDIISLVSVVISEDEYLCKADLNLDNIVNVLDIVNLVDIVLNL